MNMEDDDTPASSLQPVHKLTRPDPLHELQLLRDLAIINERTEWELGPRPHQTAPAEPKRKPKLEQIARSSGNEILECNDMNPTRIAMAATLGLSLSQPALAVEKPASSSRDIPKSVRSVIGNDRVVIAYQAVDSDDGRGKTVALVTRTQTKGPAPSDPDYVWKAEFACELVVIDVIEDHATIKGRSRGAVNCDGNNTNKRAGYRGLDENLDLSSGMITFKNYSNSTAAGWFSYSFFLNSGKWIVSSAKAEYHFNETDDEGYLVFTTEEASFPKDFGLIPMEDLDPIWMAETISKHRTKSR